MNELIEKLLQPLTAEQPCGPDLSNQPPYDELDRMLKGKPSIQVGSVEKAAEPPEWRELKTKSAEYLARSKHLRAALMFCGGSLQTAGLPGFRDGLQLIRGLVERSWATVHPPLDVEDNNDPTQRLNILGALNSPRGTLRPDIQQWLAIIDYLYSAPLCRPKGAAPVTLDMAVAAHRRLENKSNATSSEGTSGAPAGMDLAQLNNAFHAAPAAEIEANRVAVSEALEALDGLDQFLTQTLGSGNTISFDELEKVLKELQGVLQSQLSGNAAEAGASPNDGSVESSAAGSASAISIRGAVRSREDVVRVIDSICDFYNQVEPSSPVPYLLRRAQKLAMMNFVEAVQELNIATVDSLKPSMGSAVEPAPPPA